MAGLPAVQQSSASSALIVKFNVQSKVKFNVHFNAAWDAVQRWERLLQAALFVISLSAIESMFEKNQFWIFCTISFVPSLRIWNKLIVRFMQRTKQMYLDLMGIRIIKQPAVHPPEGDMPCTITASTTALGNLTRGSSLSSPFARKYVSSVSITSINSSRGTSVLGVAIMFRLQTKRFYNFVITFYVAWSYRF
jgi:hypothetical protein